MLSSAKPFQKNSILYVAGLCLVVLLNACSNLPNEFPSEALGEDQVQAPDTGSGIDEALSFVPAPNPGLSIFQSASIAIHPYDRSVLSTTQKIRLYTASQNFLAPTTARGIQVAQGLEFIGGDYGHPSNMCGPLAMGILRDAGLVSPYVDLSEYWNLDPRVGMGDDIIERTFPRDIYFWYQTDTQLDQFNFDEFPLYTGDFVYIYAGDSGTFEHILTVTRVDEIGRAYTTTNILRDNNEYFIEELLLYDPNNPGQGIFYYWTDRANVDLGITGFGGFSLWRPITPIPEITTQQKQLAKALDQVIANAGGYWNILIKEVGGETIYASQSNMRIQTSSVSKLPTAMLFFQGLEQRGLDITMEFLESSGTNGRSYAQLLEAMLVISEEDATETLEDWVSEWMLATDVFASWGFPSTQLTPRQFTLEDIVGLFEALYTGDLIGLEGREIILDYLSEYPSNDDSRLGTLHAFLSFGSEFYDKRGSLSDDRPIVAQVAIIEFGDKEYLLAFFSEPTDWAPTTYEDLVAAMQMLRNLFGAYVAGINSS